MARGAARTAMAILREGEKELLPSVLALGEVRKRIAYARPENGPGVVFRIKRFNTADELSECFLDRGFVDRRRAESGGEEDLVFGQRGEFRDEPGKVRIAIRTTESHFDCASEGPGHRALKVRRPSVREEFRLGEARVYEAHRVAAGHPGHAGAGDGGVAESVLLLVARTATNGVVARQSFVVKEKAAKGRAGVRGWIVRCRVIPEDVTGFRLLCVVRQRGEIDHAILGLQHRTCCPNEHDCERESDAFHR